MFATFCCNGFHMWYCDHVETQNERLNIMISFFNCDDDKFINTIEVARFIVDQIDGSEDMCEDAFFRFIRANIERSLKYYEYRKEILIDVLQNDDESQAIELFDNYKLLIDDVAKSIIDHVDRETLQRLGNVTYKQNDDWQRRRAVKAARFVNH